MPEEKKTFELIDKDLEKVAGGDKITVPRGTDEQTDIVYLENLTDNKGDDE